MWSLYDLKEIKNPNKLSYPFLIQLKHPIEFRINPYG